MLRAVKTKSRLYREELHANEIPISYLAYQNAEINRDRKKSKPYKLEDFYMYPVDGSKDTVDAIYGAAVKQMVKDRVYPHWALGAYKELIVNADQCSPPQKLYFMNDDVVLLAPRERDGYIYCMLIAKYKARESTQLVKSNLGDEIKVKIGDVKGSVGFEENAFVEIFYKL